MKKFLFSVFGFFLFPLFGFLAADFVGDLGEILNECLNSLQLDDSVVRWVHRSTRVFTYKLNENTFELCFRSSV